MAFGLGSRAKKLGYIKYTNRYVPFSYIVGVEYCCRGRIQGGGDINTALGLLPDKLKTELALHVNLSVLKKVRTFVVTFGGIGTRLYVGTYT